MPWHPWKKISAGSEEKKAAPGAKADNTTDALKDLVKKLGPFVRDREARPAKQLAKQMAQSRWPAPYAETVATLVRLVSGYKFREAQDLLTQLAGQLEE